MPCENSRLLPEDCFTWCGMLILGMILFVIRQNEATSEDKVGDHVSPSLFSVLKILFFEIAPLLVCFSMRQMEITISTHLAENMLGICIAYQFFYH